MCGKDVARRGVATAQRLMCGKDVVRRGEAQSGAASAVRGPSLHPTWIDVAAEVARLRRVGVLRGKRVEERAERGGGGSAAAAAGAMSRQEVLRARSTEKHRRSSRSTYKLVGHGIQKFKLPRERGSVGSVACSTV
jgi:hypothetical protein